MKKLIAYCTQCGSLQGTYDNVDQMRLKIADMKKCWHCGTEFGMLSDGRTWNLRWETVDDTSSTISETNSGKMNVSPIFRGRDFPSESNLCFALIPLSEQFLRIYNDHIKPTIESLGLRILKADDIYTSGSIVEQIWECINRARMIIGDMTGRNPNVFYELGIAHTLGKDAIILTQHEEDVPFDLRHLRYLTYTDDKAGWQELREKLGRAVRAIVGNTVALVYQPPQESLKESDVQNFVNSLSKRSAEDALSEYRSIPPPTKKKIFHTIIDRMLDKALLSQTNVTLDKNSLEFLGKAIESEENDQERIELFEVVFNAVFKTIRLLRIFDKELKYELLSIANETCALSSIRNWIKETNQMDVVISGFGDSDSFKIAKKNARIVLNLSDLMSDEQLNAVVAAASKNDQIYRRGTDSRGLVHEFLSLHKAKISKDLLEEFLAK